MRPPHAESFTLLHATISSPASDGGTECNYKDGGAPPNAVDAAEMLCSLNADSPAHPKYVDSGGDTIITLNTTGSNSAIAQDVYLRQTMGSAIAEYYDQPPSAGRVYQVQVEVSTTTPAPRRALQPATTTAGVHQNLQLRALDVAAAPHGQVRILKLRWQLRALTSDATWALKQLIKSRDDVATLKTKMQARLTSTSNKMKLSALTVFGVVGDITVDRNPEVLLEPDSVASDNLKPLTLSSATMDTSTFSLPPVANAGEDPYDRHNQAFLLIPRHVLEVEFSRPDGSKPVRDDLYNEPGLEYVGNSLAYPHRAGFRSVSDQCRMSDLRSPCHSVLPDAQKFHAGSAECHFTDAHSLDRIIHAT